MQRRTLFAAPLAFAIAGRAAAAQSLKGKRILIVYYSRAGENWGGGGPLVNLKVGNTKRFAQKIHAITDGDMFEIETVKAYPAGYRATTEVAAQELREEARPAMKRPVPDMSGYDVIFLGHPIWWGKMPRVVMNFVEQAKFAGKIVIPFCTHGGSGLGSSPADIRRVHPDADVRAGIGIPGVEIEQADGEIRSWLASLGF